MSLKLTTSGKYKLEIERLIKKSDIVNATEKLEKLDEMRKLSPEDFKEFKEKITNINLTNLDPAKTQSLFESLTKSLESDLLGKLLLVITIAILLNYVLHMTGIVQNTFTNVPKHNFSSKEAYQAFLQKVSSEMEGVAYIGKITNMLNSIINKIIKKWGALANPGTVIGTRDAIIAIGDACKKVINNIGKKNKDENAEEYDFYRALKSLRAAFGTGITVAASLSYKHWSVSVSKFLGVSDVSGHSYLLTVSALEAEEIPVDGKFDLWVKKIWFYAIMFSSTITIIYYHTVPEYLAGMLAGFVIQKTAGTLVNILWRRIMGYYPNLIDNVGYNNMRSIQKKIAYKQKREGGSKKYKNKTLKKRNKRKIKSFKNKITSKKRKKKKKTKKSFK